MQFGIIYTLITIFPFILADSDPRPSDILPASEDSFHAAHDEPEHLLVSLDDVVPAFQEIRLAAQLARVCPHGIVDFAVPPVQAVRGPISIFSDIRDIYSAIKRNETDFTLYNVRVQQLLFERLMVFDLHSDISTLQSLDRAFRETYEILYNRIFNNPVISTERRAHVQEASSNLLRLRSPLIQVLYSGRASPNRQELLDLRSALESATALRVRACAQAPEERLLSDISRGMNAISDTIVTMMFDGMRRRLRSTQTTVLATPCVSTLVCVSSSTRGHI